MKSTLDRKDIELAKLAELAMATLVTNFTRDGLIDPVGKTHEQIAIELGNLIQRYEFLPIIDHTQDILTQARAFRKVKQNEFACLFYAMWFEHTLNGFISAFARRMDFSDKEIENIIRETSYKSKLSWLPRLFGERPFSSVHENSIVRLMDARNFFVHYKWKVESEQTKKELESILSEIEKTVKYTHHYEIKYVVGVSRRKITNLLKRA